MSDLVDRDLRRQDSVLIWRYLIPNLIRQAGLAVLGLFRVAMVSNLSPEAISAMGSIDFINSIITGIGLALGIGGLLVVARYYNRGDYETTGRAAGIALLISCAVSLLVCLPYFFFRRNLINLFFGAATEQVKTYMAEYAAFTAPDCVIFNIIAMGFAIQNAVRVTRPQGWLSILQYGLTLLFSYIFIYGGGFKIGTVILQIPAMGVGGAGLGMLTSSLITWLILQVMLLRERRYFDLTKLANYIPNRRLVRDILSYGLPPVAEYTIFYISRLLTQSIVVMSGTINTAANAIGNSISVFYMFAAAAGQLTLISLGSQALGREDFRNINYYNRFINLFNFSTHALMSVIYLLFSNPILGLFTKDPAIIARTNEILIVYVIVSPLIHNLTFNPSCLLQGLGDVRFVTVVSSIATGGVRLFFSWLFAIPFNLQLTGIWLAVYVDWVFRMIVFNLRFYRRKWLPVSVAAASPSDEAGSSDSCVLTAQSDTVSGDTLPCYRDTVAQQHIDITPGSSNNTAHNTEICQTETERNEVEQID